MPSSDSAADLTQLARLEIQSAEDVVYEALRREIVAGLPPETGLRLRDLADRFGLSTMPIRTALDRLEADGLVVQRPRRGAVVAPMSRDALNDIYAVRVGLEGVAARLGCERMTSQDLLRMEERLRTLEAAGQPASGSLDAYLESEWSVSMVCYDATGHASLINLIVSFHRQAERYLRAALGDADLLADAARHRALLEACRARDAAGAQAIATEMLEWTVESLADKFSFD